MSFRSQVREFDSTISEAFPPVNRWILYLSVGFTLIAFLAEPIGKLLLQWLGCTPRSVIPGMQIWRLVTYALLHGGIMHLAVNMLGLYFFGNRIEYNWGTDRYLKFAIIAVAFAALLHIVGSLLLVALGSPAYILEIPMVGASGLVFAVMMVAACQDPDSPLFIFPFPVAIKLKYYVIVIGLLTLLSIPKMGGIAHLAHLGGLIIGYIFYKNPWWLDRIPSLPTFRKKRRGPEIHYGGRGAWRKL
jgi:membrane associated rhomboid family serine protease